MRMQKKTAIACLMPMTATASHAVILNPNGYHGFAGRVTYRCALLRSYQQTVQISGRADR